ncbi:MAG: adenosylcobinamide-GDP ribazoletransferase [Anaerolineae bacterium]|nr:adenosylcobinamide-GDP ribazoletransferase [Anaerolineae bacterium]
MLDDVRRAFAFLTVLPVGSPEGGQPGRAFAYFPLVGLAIGLAVGLVASVMALPPGVTAFLALAVWVALTGGLHLDGFGDACDGLFAAVAPARRLEIMKDARAGSWAVVGLALLLLGKWSALGAVTPLLLVLPAGDGALGDDGGGVCLSLCAPLRDWGLLPRGAGPGAGRGGDADRARCRRGGGRARAGWAAALAAAAVGPLVALLAGRWAAGRLGGGLTGDVYGALCELTELACLIVLSGVEAWANA